MAGDIYNNFSEIFMEKHTQREHYTILSLPKFSYAGSRQFIITPELEYRPDLISYYEYGTIDYEDYVTVFNGMLDPVKEYVAGRTIYLPAVEEIQRVIGE